MTDADLIADALAANGEDDTPENRAAYADLIARLRAADDPEPPAGWEERLDDKRKRRSWRRVLLRFAAGLAACAVIALCLYLWVRQ